jgi:hypothetical protein
MLRAVDQLPLRRSRSSRFISNRKRGSGSVSNRPPEFTAGVGKPPASMAEAWAFEDTLASIAGAAGAEAPDIRHFEARTTSAPSRPLISYQQLRPTGWGLQKSDLAAPGGSRGQEVRRKVAGWDYLSESFEPVLALAAGSDCNVLHWRSNSPRTPEPVPPVTADSVLVRGFDRPL